MGEIYLRDEFFFGTGEFSVRGKFSGEQCSVKETFPGESLPRGKLSKEELGELIRIPIFRPIQNHILHQFFSKICL